MCVCVKSVLEQHCMLHHEWAHVDSRGNHNWGLSPIFTQMNLLDHTWLAVFTQNKGVTYKNPSV